MDTCAKCGAALGVGRFCLNCGHPIGAPVPDATTRTARVPRERHEAAAEQARRLQGPDEAPARRAAAEVRDASPDAWLLGQGDVEDGPARLHWWAWVLFAAALVAAVMLGLSYLGDGGLATDGDDAPATTEEVSGGPERSGSGAGSSAPGRAVDLARGARVEVPATAPPTTDLDGSLVSYEAERMVDGRPRTAWRMPGDGTGAEIAISLERRAVVSEVGLVNGYARRVAGVDWYPHNRRVLEVTWTFDDGTSVDQVLQERRGLQTMRIDPVRTRSVTLTLTRVSIPGSGGLGRDYTVISTLVVKGRRAG